MCRAVPWRAKKQMQIQKYSRIETKLFSGKQIIYSTKWYLMANTYTDRTVKLIPSKHFSREYNSRPRMCELFGSIWLCSWNHNSVTHFSDWIRKISCVCVWILFICLSYREKILLQNIAWWNIQFHFKKVFFCLLAQWKWKKVCAHKNGFAFQTKMPKPLLRYFRRILVVECGEIETSLGFILYLKHKKSLFGLVLVWL